MRASVTDIYDDAGEPDRLGHRVRRHHGTPPAEDERRAVEQLHSTVIEAVDEGIVVADASGIVVAANPAALRILAARRRDRDARLVDCITGPDGIVGADRRQFAATDHPVARALARNEAMHDVLIGLVDRRRRTLALAELPPAARHLGRGRRARCARSPTSPRSSTPNRS